MATKKAPAKKEPAKKDAPKKGVSSKPVEPVGKNSAKSAAKPAPTKVPAAKPAAKPVAATPVAKPAAKVAAKAPTAKPAVVKSAAPSAPAVKSANNGKAPNGKAPSGKVENGKPKAPQASNGKTVPGKAPAGSVPVGKAVAGKTADTKSSVAKVPAASSPAAKTVAAKAPDTKTPAVKAPVDKTPVGKTPAALKSAPAGKQAPASKADAGKKDAPKKDASGKPEPAAKGGKAKPDASETPIVPKKGPIDLAQHRSVAEAAAAVANARGGTGEFIIINGRRVRAISTKGIVVPKKSKSSAAEVAAAPSEQQIREIKTKLGKKELEEYRALLHVKRRQLVGMLNGMEDEALRSSGGNLSNMPVHMADMGSDVYEQDFTLGMAETERAIVNEIDAALQRIEDKTFGVCQMTGKPISKARLDAKPWAKYTIEAERIAESSGSR
ncbi:MAG: ral stress protein [Planctomycetota bacterium]